MIKLRYFCSPEMKVVSVWFEGEWWLLGIVISLEGETSFRLFMPLLFIQSFHIPAGAGVLVTLFANPHVLNRNNYAVRNFSRFKAPFIYTRIKIQDNNLELKSFVLDLQGFHELLRFE